MRQSIPESRRAVVKLQEIVFPGELQEGTDVTLVGEPFSALLFREPHSSEVITLVDASGQEFRARILNLVPDHASVHVFEKLSKPTESCWKLVLLQALPDKERMELIVQKATELGVHMIVPFKSRRSISLEAREARQAKAHRWQHIAIRATKQCRRACVPYVAPYCSYEGALAQTREAELKIVLWEKAQRSLRSFLRDVSPQRSVALMVGPEGGWDADEIAQAQTAGFVSVGMGGRILRTETAAIASCATLQFEWEGL